MNHIETLSEAEHIDQLSIPQLTPAQLDAMHPLAPGASEIVQSNRRQIIDIMQGRDPRLIVMVGPCSMDASKIDGRYTTERVTERLQEISASDERIAEHILVMERNPWGKPRTALGSRGLAQHDMVLAHQLSTFVANEGMPLAAEIMTPGALAQHAGRLSLAWLGARNIGDTNIRHTMSAYRNLPVFCKNGETGDLAVALSAMKTIGAQHQNAEVMRSDGTMGHVPLSPGNLNTGLLWRGGSNHKTPSTYRDGLLRAAEKGVPYGIDLSHGGAVAHDWKQEKSVTGIKRCFERVTALMAGGLLARQPALITFEANWLEGADTSGNTPGMSCTDPCIGIEDVADMLRQLAEVRAGQPQKQLVHA